MLNKQVQIHHESLCSNAAELPHLLSLVPTAVMPCSPRNFCITGCPACCRDDIDALILQTEGCKRWRLYAPASPDDLLPQTSSPDLTPIDLGEPFLDTVLRRGDLLYMPRGCIHQVGGANHKCVWYCSGRAAARWRRGLVQANVPWCACR